jgi:hypothetical protein
MLGLDFKLFDSLIFESLPTLDNSQWISEKSRHKLYDQHGGFQAAGFQAVFLRVFSWLLCAGIEHVFWPHNSGAERNSVGAGL